MANLPVPLSYKFDKNTQHGHTFFIQQHVVRKQENFADSDSILLVMNVAPYCRQVLFLCFVMSTLVLLIFLEGETMFI